MTRLAFAAALMLGVAACSAPVPEAQRRASSTENLPAMKLFSAPVVTRSTEANPDLAHDFMELSFAMESGRAVPMLTRFEGPVTVALTGHAPPSVGPDLDKLLARLRTEAGIDISRANGAGANITVEFLGRAALQAVVPNAACFVVPNVGSWSEFRRSRNARRVDWTSLSSREQVAVFVPNDTSPQEMRDCLHEEIAQALGPLNDLYRLPDSVFNDDNFNTVLTGFDMLMLRLTYAPDLHSGMSSGQVAALLPQILARINPAGQSAGQSAGRMAPGPTPRDWVDTLETALGGKAGHTQRLQAAQHAVALARTEGWRDSRMAFSLFVLGRLSVSKDGAGAEQAFAEARRLYQAIPGSAVHLAHVDMQLAATALKDGRAEQALALVNESLMPVAGSENAALLATLLMLKSEALAQLNRASEARAVRLDSLGWARYGFGPEAEVRARMSEIASLAPGRS